MPNITIGTKISQTTNHFSDCSLRVACSHRHIKGTKNNQANRPPINKMIEKAKTRVAQINTIVGHPDRLKEIADNIVNHFEKRQEVFEGKAMVVCMTRQIAVDLYAEITALRPSWHNDDLSKGKIKVVMTSSSDDPIYHLFMDSAFKISEKTRFSNKAPCCGEVKIGSAEVHP